jgi:hypothetical protein
MFHIGKLYKIQLLSGSPIILAAMTTNHTPFAVTGEEVLMLLSVRKAPYEEYNIFGILNSEGYSGEILMKPHEMILVSSD